MFKTKSSSVHFREKMDRKLNLAKLAKSKNVLSSVKNTGITPTQSPNSSPYFSPIANRTRNKQLKKGVDLVKKIGKLSTVTTAESVEKIEKKFKQQKHVKSEHDESKNSNGKSEIEKPSTATSSDSIEKVEKKFIRQKHIELEHDEGKKSNGKSEIAGSSTATLPNSIQRLPSFLCVEKKVIPRKHIKLEYDENVESEGDKTSENGITSNTKNETKKRKSTDKASPGSVSETSVHEKQMKWQPKNWQQMFENIQKMRANRDAPVDSMGCDKCFDADAEENIKRFHHLIALMLSSQTKDAVTYEAMNRLKKYGLTPQRMIDVDGAELEQLLYPVSFYKTKTKHIKRASQILVDKYDSDIPNNVKEMIDLPGVGPKMAHILMRVAWNIVSGIGVDTHVHRITNRLKWTKKETKTPEETRVALESWLPFDLWWEVNELLVGFGQSICKPVNPLCSGCLNYDICPSRVVKKKN